MRRIVTGLLVAGLSVLLTAPAPADQAGKPADAKADWRPLFDGKTLAGWHAIGKGVWTVEDGAIVGRHDKKDDYGHLVTDQSYKDFTVRLKFKNLKGNSGLYFRIAVDAKAFSGVSGFQAEIDPRSDVGGLYETNGRGWVVKPKPEDVKTWLKPDDWNEMTVIASGGDITVTVNGTKTAEVKDDKGKWTEGPFALQVHGGQDGLVYFKDIEIRAEPANAPRAGRIGPGDLLAINVLNLLPLPGPDWLERVEEDGRAHLPYVGYLKLGGLTTIQAESAVAQAMADQKLMLHPTAAVRRLEVGAAASVKAGPVGNGDLLRVTMIDVVGRGTDLVRDVRVQADGRIAVPFLDEGLAVEGKTASEVELLVAMAYEDKKIVLRAAASVLRLEAGDRATVPVGPVGAGDLLAVTQHALDFPDSETTRLVRVGADGTASLPFLEPVKLTGLNEIAAAAAVTKAYSDANIAVNVAATVLRVEAAERASVKAGPIEPGDLVHIAASDLMGPWGPLTKLTRVGPDGQVGVWFIGPVKAAGRTEAELAKAIADRFREMSVVQRAPVSVLKVELAPDGGGDLPDVPLKPLPAPVQRWLDAPRDPSVGDAKPTGKSKGKGR